MICNKNVKNKKTKTEDIYLYIYIYLYDQRIEGWHLHDEYEALLDKLTDDSLDDGTSSVALFLGPLFGVDLVRQFSMLSLSSLLQLLSDAFPQI